MRFIPLIISFLLLAPGASSSRLFATDGRCAMWIDIYRGEPIPYKKMLDDLAEVRVVYVGERHTLERHHEIQTQILTGLAQLHVRLVVGLEQMESVHQPTLDRFNRSKIDFEQLAQETNWAERWGNYEQYRPILEEAHRFEVPVIALNARAETIREVFRNGGIEELSPELRQELPTTVELDDPVYEKLLRMQMMVHASLTETTLRPMIEAQMARDEAMAATLVNYLKSPAGGGRTALVICGAGHVAYRLGIPARVDRRLDGARQRIVLLSASGDVELSPHEQAMAREIEITHQQLRQIDRPVADYLHAIKLATKTEQK